MTLQASLDTLSQPQILSLRLAFAIAALMNLVLPLSLITYQLLPSLSLLQKLEPLTLTPLSDAEVKKTLHLCILADNISYGFYFGPRITCNPLPGTGNTLLKIKTLPLGPISNLQLPTVMATSMTPHPHPVHPTTLQAAKLTLEWPYWLATL